MVFVALAASAPAFSGFDIKADYLDPNGATVSIDGKNAHFVFNRRTLYRRPRGPAGEKFRDDEKKLDALSFSGHHFSFQSLREIRFERRVEGGRERLVVVLELVTGERIEKPGSELDGADHPISPSIDFTASSGPVSLAIDPVTLAEGRRGRATPVRISFPGNLLRRPSPRR